MTQKILHNKNIKMLRKLLEPNFKILKNKHHKQHQALPHQLNKKDNNLSIKLSKQFNKSIMKLRRLLELKFKMQNKKSHKKQIILQPQLNKRLNN